MGGPHKEGAEILVATFGDPTEQSAIAGRLLLRHEAKPSCEVPSLLEATAGTDGCDDGTGDDRADTRHGG
jgi:hypothetical protein